MASFAPRIEVRDGARFKVSDDGDLYALREMYEMGDGKSVYQVDIKPGDRVLDIGAHKGFFAIWAAKRGARVTAYEPDRESYKVLLENVIRNEPYSLPPSHFNNAVGGERATDRDFYAARENSIGSTFYRERIADSPCDKYGVHVVSLDDALDIDEWNLVKLDAEEAEYEILLPSIHLKQIKQLVIEWHRPHGRQEHPLFVATIEKLSKFFEVPPTMTNQSWPIPMRRK